MRIKLEEINYDDCRLQKEIPTYLYENLCKFYPNIIEWYLEKVIPDIKENYRKIYIYTYKNKIYGICIIRIKKNKYKHNKICTLFLSEKIRNKSYGFNLFTKIIKTLKKDIIFTTSKIIYKNNYNLKYLLKIFDFKKCHEIKNKYKKWIDRINILPQLIHIFLQVYIDKIKYYNYIF